MWVTKDANGAKTVTLWVSHDADTVATLLPDGSVTCAGKEYKNMQAWRRKWKPDPRYFTPEWWRIKARRSYR